MSYAIMKWKNEQISLYYVRTSPIESLSQYLVFTGIDFQDRDTTWTFSILVFHLANKSP